ncbi:transcriptional regulator domain-containing protein [Sphingomonas oligophenolica]
MWEWLRRDPDYVAWYVRASQATRGPGPVEPSPAWGLHFRGAAGRRRAGCHDHLARRSRSRHPDRGGRSGATRQRWRVARSARTGALAQDRTGQRRHRACGAVRRVSSHSAGRRRRKPGRGRARDPAL